MARLVYPSGKDGQRSMSAGLLFLDPVAGLQEDNLEVAMSDTPGHPTQHQVSLKLNEIARNNI